MQDEFDKDNAYVQRAQIALAEQEVEKAKKPKEVDVLGDVDLDTLFPAKDFTKSDSFGFVEPSTYNLAGQLAYDFQQEQEDKPTPSFTDTLSAAFVSENSVASTTTYGIAPANTPQEGFNSLTFTDEFLAGEDEDFILEVRGKMIGVENEKLAKHKLNNILEERENRKILEEAGGWGVAAQMVAATLDPVDWLAVAATGGIGAAGKVAKYGKIGAVAAKAASGVPVINKMGKYGKIGATATSGAAAQETVLQNTQELRTWEESLTSVLSSGVTASALSKFMSVPADVKTYAKNRYELGEENSIIEEVVYNRSPRDASAAETKVVDYDTNRIAGAVGKETKLAQSVRNVIKEKDLRYLQDIDFKNIPSRLLTAGSRFTINGRIALSANNTVREFGQRFTSTHWKTDENVANLKKVKEDFVESYKQKNNGKAPTDAQVENVVRNEVRNLRERSPSAEDRINVLKSQFMVNSAYNIEEAVSKIEGATIQGVDRIVGVMNRNGDDFEKALPQLRKLSEEDGIEIPTTPEAIQTLNTAAKNNRGMLNSLTKMMQDVGMIKVGDEVDDGLEGVVSGAESYLNRVYKSEVIKENREDFENILADAYYKDAIEAFNSITYLYRDLQDLAEEAGVKVTDEFGEFDGRKITKVIKNKVSNEDQVREFYEGVIKNFFDHPKTESLKAKLEDEGFRFPKYEDLLDELNYNMIRDNVWDEYTLEDYFGAYTLRMVKDIEKIQRKLQTDPAYWRQVAGNVTDTVTEGKVNLVASDAHKQMFFGETKLPRSTMSRVVKATDNDMQKFLVQDASELTTRLSNDILPKVESYRAQMEMGIEKPDLELRAVKRKIKEDFESRISAFDIKTFIYKQQEGRDSIVKVDAENLLLTKITDSKFKFTSVAVERHVEIFKREGYQDIKDMFGKTAADDYEKIFTKTIKDLIELQQRKGEMVDPNTGKNFDQVLSDAEFDEVFKKNGGADFKQKYRSKYVKQLKQEIEDVGNVHKLLLGEKLYDPNTTGGAILRNLRSVNYLAYLGGMIVTAIPEIANNLVSTSARVSAEKAGVSKVFAKSVKSVLKTQGRKSLERQGGLVEMAMNTRGMEMMDRELGIKNQSRFDKGMNYTTNKFGMVTLMTPYNQFMKSLNIYSNMDTIARLARMGDDITPEDMLVMKKFGLAEEDMVGIRAQSKHFANAAAEGDADIFDLRTDLWDDKALGIKVIALLRRESEAMVVTPSVGDRPTWMASGEIAKTIGQFSSFMFASMNKRMLGNMSDPDLKFLQSIVVQIGLGFAVIEMKNALTTDEYKFKARDEAYFYEAVDRSGAVPFLALGSRAWNMIGAGDTNRYEQSSAIGSLAGVSLSTIQKGLQGIGAGLDGDFDGAAKDLSRIAPMQNLIWFKLFGATTGYDRSDLGSDAMELIE